MTYGRTVIPLLVIVAVASGCAGSIPAVSSSGPSSPPPTSVPVLSPAVSIPATAQPSPSGVSVLGASGSGAFGAGTYATAFQPALTFTLAELTIAGSDGRIAYESVGEVDVNEPGWISIAFGFDKPKPHGHGTWSADVFITRIDKVFDPNHSGTLSDPPKDLATWITKLPGLTLAAPPKKIKIGGLDATQLDVVSGASEVAIGPIPGATDPPAFGFGPHHPQRIDVVSVDGHEVLIAIGADDSVAHFKRAVVALQPLVDSIVWK